MATLKIQVKGTVQVAVTLNGEALTLENLPVSISLESIDDIGEAFSEGRLERNEQGSITISTKPRTIDVTIPDAVLVRLMAEELESDLENAI